MYGGALDLGRCAHCSAITYCWFWSTKQRNVCVRAEHAYVRVCVQFVLLLSLLLLLIVDKRMKFIYIYINTHAHTKSKQIVISHNPISCTLWQSDTRFKNELRIFTKFFMKFHSDFGPILTCVIFYLYTVHISCLFCTWFGVKFWVWA